MEDIIKPAEDIDAANVADTADVKHDPTPSLQPDNILSLLTADSRVAHFMIDILHGRDPDETALQYFKTSAQAAPDIDSAVSQAEQRGYLRGRNEVIETQMRSRQVWETAPGDIPDNPSPQILAHIRKSVWE